MRPLSTLRRRLSIRLGTINTVTSDTDLRQLFGPGTPVDIFIVEDGHAWQLMALREMFSFGPSDSEIPKNADFRFSGFRIHAPYKRSDVVDELVAFNGASYFRSMGRKQSYGLSARGLAINTASSEPEEFPRFTKFWIEKSSGAISLKVHALLDSPSITGSYHFHIQTGTNTIIEVDATVFARREIDQLGIAPLTSMFLFDSRNHQNFNDYRAAVHDSDGLALQFADGRRIWRPLLNPSAKQITRVPAEDIQGFGLIQRKRTVAEFGDLEATYETRPSAWVEPSVGWNDGDIFLMELPIGAEWGDNIVAFWQPRKPLKSAQSMALSYRVHWRDDAPGPIRRVVATHTGFEAGKHLFVIDYEAKSGGSAPTEAMVTVTAGAATSPIVQNNVHTNGIRCFFSFSPADNKTAELSLALRHDSRSGPDLTSEIWRYRWLA